MPNFVSLHAGNSQDRGLQKQEETAGQSLYSSGSTDCCVGTSTLIVRGCTPYITCCERCFTSNYKYNTNDLRCKMGADINPHHLSTYIRTVVVRWPTGVAGRGGQTVGSLIQRRPDYKSAAQTHVACVGGAIYHRNETAAVTKFHQRSHGLHQATKKVYCTVHMRSKS